MTTAASSQVNLINGGSAGNGVYWLVGSSATLGADTTFAGNILANTSITLDNSAQILGGRAIALNGAVTMDTNIINFASPVPEPEEWAMLLLGLPMLGWAIKRKKAYNISSFAAVAA